MNAWIKKRIIKNLKKQTRKIIENAIQEEWPAPQKLIHVL